MSLDVTIDQSLWNFENGATILSHSFRLDKQIDRIQYGLAKICKRVDTRPLD